MTPISSFLRSRLPMTSLCGSQASFYSYINSVLLKMPLSITFVNGRDNGSLTCKKKKFRRKVLKHPFKIVLCFCLWLCPACFSIVWGGQDLSSFGAGTSFPVGAQPHAQFCPNCHPMCQPQDAPVPGCSPCGSGHRGYRLPFLCASHYPPLWSGHEGETTGEQGTLALPYLYCF